MLRGEWSIPSHMPNLGKVEQATGGPTRICTSYELQLLES